MKLNKNILAASLLCAAISGDVVADEEKPFTGPYLGIEGGFGSVNQGIEERRHPFSIGLRLLWLSKNQ